MTGFLQWLCVVAGEKTSHLIWGTEKVLHWHGLNLASVHFSFDLFLLQNQFSLQVKYIFTLGDVAQLCPARVDKRAFLLMQSILAASASAEHCKALGVPSVPAASGLGLPCSSAARPLLPSLPSCSDHVGPRWQWGHILPAHLPVPGLCHALCDQSTCRHHLGWVRRHGAASPRVLCDL